MKNLFNYFLLSIINLLLFFSDSFAEKKVDIKKMLAEEAAKESTKDSNL
jgi:hypothetical protein